MLKFFLLLSVCLNLVLLYILSQQVTSGSAINDAIANDSVTNDSELLNNSFYNPDLPTIQLNPESTDENTAPINEALHALLRLANDKQWQALDEPLREYLKR